MGAGVQAPAEAVDEEEAAGPGKGWAEGRGAVGCGAAEWELVGGGLVGGVAVGGDGDLSGEGEL